MSDREGQVRTQYEAWLIGRSPVALYVRWYLRYGGAPYAEPLFAAMGDGCFPCVLDVGCATGFNLEWAFTHGHGHRLLAGVDLSPVMLSEADVRLRPAVEDGVGVRLVEASATALPFPDDFFDALICNGVVKYLDDEMFSAFLGEASRVLRSGGRLAVADFDRPVAVQSALMPPRLLGIPVDHLRSAHALCQAMANNGFRDAAPVRLKRVLQVPLTYAGAVGARR